MENASTRKHRNDSIHPEIKTAPSPLRAPHVSESIGKEGRYSVTEVIDPD